MYPDLVIASNPETYDGTLDPPALANPVAIIEVLSPSTEARDRGDKFLWYQTIPSLREYIRVSQWTRRFEYFLRSDAGQWVYRGDLTNPSTWWLPRSSSASRLKRSTTRSGRRTSRQ
jgi:Uma2 family endonuclease